MSRYDNRISSYENLKLKFVHWTELSPRRVSPWYYHRYLESAQTPRVGYVGTRTLSRKDTKGPDEKEPGDTVGYFFDVRYWFKS